MEIPINLHIGALGEDLAVKFLRNKGFTVVCRNYRKKWGEIDIVCEYRGVTHFVEVKSVSRITLSENADIYRPEDNLHANKAKRLRRIIESYVEEHSVGSNFVCDLITVQIYEESKTARIQFLSDIII